MNATPQAAYIHVPFCRHRCGYCDFPLITGRDDLIGDYLRALEIELSSLEEPQEVQTLFFGGGTPTHLPPEQLRQLLALCRRWLRLADEGEFSVEANPGDLDRARIDVLVEAGVNRLSLGAQSFDDSSLAVLERDHTPEQIAAVVEMLRQAGIRNISVDLIFAVPNQSVADWRLTLEAAIALAVPHVSTYGLTYEKGTAFWTRRSRGTLCVIDEETERQMYAHAMEVLPEAGLAQYEISNFAQPGFECRHNLTYWRGDPYWACGPGAARYVGGIRSTNHRSVTTWLKRTLAGHSAVAETEALGPEERARELVLLGLRRTGGINSAAFRNRTGYELADLAGAAYRRLLDEELLEEADGRLRLTYEGRFLADSVIAEFL